MRAVFVWACGLLAAAVPAWAQADWAQAGWSARCASTAILTRLTVAGRGLSRLPDCHFAYIAPDGSEQILTVGPETRRAVEAVMDDIARWFARRSFPEPRVRRVGDGPLTVSDEAWQRGTTQPELGPHDPGRPPGAFEVLLDPLPTLRGLHSANIAGFYSPRLAVMVMRVDPLRPADSGAGAAPVRVPAGLASVDPDTLAHELFHAIARGLHGGATSAFVEEGLAEMFGNLYAADRSGLPAPHPLAARFGDGRFTRAPLMSVAGNDAYDTAPFWRFIHDSEVWPHTAAFVRLLRDYDLTVPVAGSVAVDDWLRAERGRDLNTVWRDFLQQVSREASAAGVLETLVQCREATPQPTEAEPDRVFESRIGRQTPRQFTAICLRLTLPLADQPRRLRVEAPDGGPIAPGMHILLNGAEVHAAPQRLEPGTRQIELVIFPWTDNGALTPRTVSHPGFRLVVEGLAQGCTGARDALRDLPPAVLDRVAAAAGPWQHWGNHSGHFGPAPGCSRAEFAHSATGSGPRQITFRDAGGVLEVPSGMRLVPVAQPSARVALGDLGGLCGPLVPPALSSPPVSPGDWVQGAGPAPQFFQVEVGGDCLGYAAIGPDRAAVAIPLHWFTGTPEHWELMLFQRPR